MAASEAAETARSVAGGIGYTGATLAYKAFNGLLPKAQLFVPKAYSIMEASDAAGALTGNNDVIALKALVKKKKAAAKAAVNNEGFKGKLKQAMGVVPVLSLVSASTVQGASVTTAMSEKNYSVMEVQYNPSSIRLSANGGSQLRRPQAGDASAQQMGMTSKISRIQLTVELVFEDINVADAFHLEGLSMNFQELAQTAMSGIANSLEGGGFSVRKQCDGLLALLNFKRLKQVVFLWADMFFHGELVNVDVRYEMFNKNGEPILARVRLTIEQNDSSNSIRYSSDDDQWNDAIDIAFGEPLLS